MEDQGTTCLSACEAAVPCPRLAKRARYQDPRAGPARHTAGAERYRLRGSGDLLPAGRAPRSRAAGRFQRAAGKRVGKRRPVENLAGQLMGAREHPANRFARTIVAPAIRHLAEAGQRRERTVDNPHHLSKRDLARRLELAASPVRPVPADRPRSCAPEPPYRLPAEGCRPIAAPRHAFGRTRGGRPGRCPGSGRSGWLRIEPPPGR